MFAWKRILKNVIEAPVLTLLKLDWAEEYEMFFRKDSCLGKERE